VSGIHHPHLGQKEHKDGELKYNPEAIRSFMENERYSFRESMGLIKSLPKATKNLKPNGKTT